MAINIATYTIPRFSSVLLGLADGTGVMNFGLREPGGITRKPSTETSVQFSIPDSHEWQIQLVGRQTRFVDFVNLYSIVSSGPHILYANSVQNRLLFFTDNTATFAAPAGTALVGGNVAYKIGQQERSLAYTGETLTAQTETDYMLTNSPLLPTLSTGSGVYLHPYDQTSFRRRGIASIQVNSLYYRIFSGAMLSLTTKEAQQGGKDFRNRPYPTTLQTRFQADILCTDYTSLEALNQAEQQAVPVVIGTWADETVTWNSGACSAQVSEASQSEQGYRAQLTVTADVPMTSSAVAISPNSMTFSLVE